jgi:glycosyltransferase involved in cell wall biosynthesis
VQASNHSPGRLAYVSEPGHGAWPLGQAQECLDLQLLGWQVHEFMLPPPATRWPGVASRTAARSPRLGANPGVLDWATGLKDTLVMRRHLWPAVRMLMTDMHRLGWWRKPAWLLAKDALCGIQLARQMQLHGCKHIHAQGLHRPTQVAMYAAALSGATFTCGAETSELVSCPPLLAQKLQRARVLVARSHHDRRQLEDLGADTRCIDIVRPTPATLSDTLPTPKLHQGPYRIGMLAALVDSSGADLLLHATAQLVASGCAPLRVLVSGEGPERLRLQMLADHLGIERLVDFVGWPREGGLSRWLQSLDLLVSPQRAGQAGLHGGIAPALLEAMAMGVPVVASRLGGVPELVIAGRTGYLAETDDATSLAQSIDQAMCEPERSRTLARAARAHVRWEFGRDTNLRRLVRHFGGHEPASTSSEPTLAQPA